MKAFRRYIRWLWPLLAIQPCFAQTEQSLQAIEDTVNQFVTGSLDPNGNYEISKPSLDPRLSLPACDLSLDAAVQSGNLQAGRNTISVSCNGANRWTIYSTVFIKSYKQVLVTVKPLARNDVLSVGDMRLEAKDVALLQKGYLSDANEALGKQSVRFVPAGSVLYQGLFTAPALVKRGETVSIQSGKPGLLISSTGVAMMDGVKGQQIKVKNVSSKRVIQATVIQPGLVNVYF